MARRRGGGRRRGDGRRKQGITSWITSIFALLLGFGPLWVILANAFRGASMEDVIGAVNRSYNPLSGDKEALKLSYGSLIGGLVFKVVSSELIKRAKVTSIIPALHA